MQSTRTSDASSSQEIKHDSPISLHALSSDYDPKDSEDMSRRSVSVGLAMTNNDLLEHLHQNDASCGPNNGNDNNLLAYKSTMAHVEGSLDNEQCLQLEGSCKKVDKLSLV